MARPKGARNKKTLLREAEQKRLASDSDGEVSVDCLQVMEQAMRHFFFKAVKEQDRGDKADQIVIDAAFNQAATLAEKVAPVRHPRLATMKLSGHPNAQEIPDGMSGTISLLNRTVASARWHYFSPSGILSSAVRVGPKVRRISEISPVAIPMRSLSAQARSTMAPPTASG